jgi:hypothetical protein
MEYLVSLDESFNVNGVRKTDFEAETDSYIQADPANAEWQLFLEWQKSQDKYAAYSVDQVKAIRIAELDVSVRSFVYTRYPPHRQQTLSFIRSEARFDGLTNRANYVGQCSVWINSCISFYFTAKATIEYMQTKEDVLAVSIDASYLGADDPEVSIGAAMSIPD